MLVSRTSYESSLAIPRHDHELASFCLVMEGEYDESYGSRRRTCRAGTVVFHPEGEHHSEKHADTVATLLTVELEAARLDELRSVSRVLGEPAHHEGGEVQRLARRLAREFHTPDSASSLAVEGLVLEILVAGSRQGRPTSDVPPPWLHRAADCLRARFRDSVTVGEIAAAVGVHPAHLTRMFRRHLRCTPGEYVRALRIEAARRAVADTDASLAEIALAAGFADQSHFSRLFRAAHGMTPRDYRRSRRVRPARVSSQ